MVKRLGFADLASPAPDDGDQRAFVLDRPGRIVRDDDVVAAADERIVRAIADVRLLRHLVLAAARIRPFDVRAVVESGGVEVPRDGGRRQPFERHSSSSRK